MTKEAYTRRRRWMHGGLLANVMIISLVALALLLAGCSDDDDDDFVGVDVGDIENRAFDFADARAFGLNGEAATLDIGVFGANGQDDEALFILTSGGFEATGVLDLAEGNLPIVRDFSRCDFRVEASDIAGLPLGEVETDCHMSRDNQELQLENRNTNEVSTGDAI